MSFILNHTVFFRFYLPHIFAILLLLVVIFIVWRKLKKLKKIKADLEHEVSSASAEVALEATPDEISTDVVNEARDVIRKEQQYSI